MSQHDIYGEISEIVAGVKPGRVAYDEITPFKFNGIAIGDIAWALKVYQKELAAEVGRS